MEEEKLIKKINELKKEKGAVILTHSYQRAEIYKVADFIGDSYELARKASQTEADLIVFCGVDFMAESAKILNPEKRVLIPTPKARCPMAAMISDGQLKELKEQHKDAAVVSYVNTRCSTKALSDICCTSSNAVEVVKSLPHKKIIFTPDRNLADYVRKSCNKKIIPWNGYCYVHDTFDASVLKSLKEKHPDAKTIVHPECRPEVVDLADYVCSTSQMLDVAREDDARQFLIGTEIGMIERLKIEVPDKEFISANEAPNICLQMKQNTLELTLKSLEEEKYEIKIDEDTLRKAKNALEGMLGLK